MSGAETKPEKSIPVFGNIASGNRTEQYKKHSLNGLAQIPIGQIKLGLHFEDRIPKFTSFVELDRLNLGRNPRRQNFLNMRRRRIRIASSVM